MTELKRHIINFEELPEMYPTHMHDAKFWENLGRTVATFAFLEETLGKAIFAFTATKQYNEDEIHKEYDKWLLKLKNALSDQLFNLIETYEKAVKEHPESTIENLDKLVEQLKEASKIRNVLCHASWRFPNQEGASIPFFVNRNQEYVETPIDNQFLLQVQNNVSKLICTVVNTVTHMGWQFPGSEGPGKTIWNTTND